MITGASLAVAAVQPETGAVQLKLSGDFLSGVPSQPGMLTIELSSKPLILLFWLGTMIAFFGGILSMLDQRRRVVQSVPVTEPADSAVRQPVNIDAA